MCVTLQVRTGMDVRTRHKPYRHHCHQVFFTKAVNVKLLTMNRYEIHFDRLHLSSFTRHPSLSSLNPNRSISIQQQVLLKACARSMHQFLPRLEHVSGAKRIKRTSSSAVLADDHSSDSDEQEDDDEDEPDSSSKLTLVCPACGSTFHRFGHLMRHAKRKHHMDLSTYDESGALELQPVETNPIDSSDNEVNRDTTKETQTIKTEDVDPLESALASQSKAYPIAAVISTKALVGEANPSSVSETGPTTDCPYCDFKTTDIEQFKFHIIAHIRDKNYRCLLCNRLYKYRGKYRGLLSSNSMYFSSSKPTKAIARSTFAVNTIDSVRIRTITFNVFCSKAPMAMSRRPLCLEPMARP